MPTPQDLFVPRSSLQQCYLVGRDLLLSKGAITFQNNHAGADAIQHTGSKLSASRSMSLIAQRMAQMGVGTMRVRAEGDRTGTVVSTTQGTSIIDNVHGDVDYDLLMVSVVGTGGPFFCTVFIPTGMSTDDLSSTGLFEVADFFFLSSLSDCTTTPGPVLVSHGEGADYTYNPAPLAGSTLGTVTPVGDPASLNLLSGATDVWVGNFAPYQIDTDAHSFTQGMSGQAASVTWFGGMGFSRIIVGKGDPEQLGDGLSVGALGVSLAHGGFLKEGSASLQIVSAAVAHGGKSFAALRAKLASLGSLEDRHDVSLGIDVDGQNVGGIPAIIGKLGSGRRGLVMLGSVAGDDGQTGPVLLLERPTDGGRASYASTNLTFPIDGDVTMLGGSVSGRPGYHLFGSLGGNASDDGPGYLLIDSHGIIRTLIGSPAWINDDVRQVFLAGAGNVNQGDASPYAIHLGAKWFNKPGIEITDDPSHPNGLSPHGLYYQVAIDAGFKHGTTDPAAVLIGRQGADVVVPAALWVGPGSQGVLYLTAHTDHVASSMPALSLEGHGGTKWYYWAEEATGILRRSSTFPTSDTDGVAITS